MIFKTASPVSPDVEITIDSVPTNYLSLQRIVIEEKENNHSLMVLDFTGIAPEVITEYIDTPVSASVAFPNLGGTTFYGYVVFLEPVSVTKDGLVNSSPFQVTRLFCMNASYVMKSKRSRTWENISLPELASQISDTYRLSLSVPNDSYRFSRLTQSSQSDWEFLVKTANRLGYSVICNGTHIDIWNPFQSLSRKSSFGVLKTLRGLNGNTTPDIGQVLRFEGRIGAVSTSGSRNLDTLYLLDSSGNLITVGNASIDEKSGFGTPVNTLFKDVMATNADNYEMGSKYVHGLLRKKFPMTATVDITGNPTLHPGGIVQLEKYDAKFDGFWYITGVRHELMRSELMTTLELAKDSLDGETVPYQHSESYEEPPSPVLLNSLWVSRTDWQKVYS